MCLKEKVVGYEKFKLTTELDDTQTNTWTFNVLERKSGR